MKRGPPSRMCSRFAIVPGGSGKFLLIIFHDSSLCRMVFFLLYDIMSSILNILPGKSGSSTDEV